MNNFTKIVFIILAISLISSCNSVKRLSDGEYLLTENKVTVNGKKTSNLDVLSYIHQRPNQKVLGMPFALYVHNWAKPKFEENVEEWITNHPTNTKFIRTVFSNKQVKELYSFDKKINRTLKKNGEAPVIINPKKTKKSVNSLKEFYQRKGFFDVEVGANEEIKGYKRKNITYTVTTNKPYTITDYKIEIESPVLKSIYDRNKTKSYVKIGKQYNRIDFEKEQNRLTKLFRNSGIYSFNKNNIYFQEIANDTTSFTKKFSLVIKDQFVIKNNNTSNKPYRIQKVTKINIFTDYSFLNKDSNFNVIKEYNGYTFYAHEKLRFNPKKLANTIVITPNDVYKDSERSATIQYLNDLKLFRSPIIIKYNENKDGNLTANINLIPLKRFGLDTKAEFTHSNIKPFGVLGKLALISRNIFNGSEILETSLQGSFINVAEDFSDPNFNLFGLSAWEIGANTSLKVPRILFPIKTEKIIPKIMRPSTSIGLSTSFQKNIGLDRQNITGNITYNWKKHKEKHQLELINVQYINNINAGNYFKVFSSEKVKLSNVAQNIIDPNSVNSDGEIYNYDNYINYVLNPLNNFETTNFDDYRSVQQVNERRSIITEDILVPVISYNYTYNGKDNIQDKSFSFLNARIVSAGSITAALTNKNDNGKKELFGLPIAQYIKTEVEYKKYWRLYNNNQLVFRTFVGAAVPFGNSTEIPFSRSYRAGGSNDIRAWKTFDLGPGSSISSLDFNIGNLKLISNLEYRFNIINNFYSALFIDAGNVWDLTNSKLTNNSAKFKGIDSIQEIAIGSGFGLRYDFSFLIFRTDFGFKTYEPYLSSGNRWFKNYNFKHTVFNFGINYPF